MGTTRKIKPDVVIKHHDDGSKTIGRYNDDDRRHGGCIQYRADGTKEFTANYCNNLLHGNYTVYELDGKTIFAVKKYDMGTPIAYRPMPSGVFNNAVSIPPKPPPIWAIFGL